MGPGNQGERFQHVPVLLTKVLRILDPTPGDIILDATLGGGGHSEAILEKVTPGGKVIGLDLDKDAIEAAKERLKPFGSAFIAIQDNFANLQKILPDLELDGVDGVLMDLGVSSYQLDSSQRGFSYQRDVFLDMRMSGEAQQTASDLLNTLSRQKLARIFKQYGEEKWADRIAAFVEKYRTQKGSLTHSGQLVEVIKNAIPAASRRKGGHPAKRVFQALRIAVNRELENLEAGLEQGIEWLKPGGRIVVISYHSLEDEIVKKRLQERANPCNCPAKFPVCQCGLTPVIKLTAPKVIFPGDEEVKINPRARSARLRAAEKLENRGKSSNTIGR